MTTTWRPWSYAGTTSRRSPARRTCLVHGPPCSPGRPRGVAQRGSQTLDGDKGSGARRHAAGEVGAAGLRRRCGIENAAHGVEPRGEGCELGDPGGYLGLLVLDQPRDLVVGRRAVGAAPDREELEDLVAAEAEPPSPRDEEELGGGVLAVLAVAGSGARRLGEEADPLVVADRRNRHPHRVGELGNAHPSTVDLAPRCSVKTLTLHPGARPTVTPRTDGRSSRGGRHAHYSEDCSRG